MSRKEYVMACFVLILIVVAIVVFREPKEEVKYGTGPHGRLSNQELEEKVTRVRTELWKVREWLRNNASARTGVFKERLEHGTMSQRQDELEAELRSLESALAERGESKSPLKPSSEAVRKGKEIFDRTLGAYPSLHSFYRIPDWTPRGISVSIPVTAWQGLAEADRDAICHYLAGMSAAWEIVVGEISQDGLDILRDRVVLTNKNWKPKRD